VSITPAVAILAGGKSRRMGQDKSLLQWNGVSWLEHAARVALEATPHVVVVGRRCPPDWPLGNVAFIDDVFPGNGPMSGIVSALSWVKTAEIASDRVLALACDTPRLTSDALKWICDEAAGKQLHHGLAVRNRGHVEPLFSIYTVRCLPLLEQRFTANEYSPGRFSLRGFIEAADFEHVDVPETIGAMLHNFNTPEDVSALNPL
jgi:molybdopterin-guanine dinucleotide biosynthesis protein A